jgi:hypothetical protein
MPVRPLRTRNGDAVSRPTARRHACIQLPSTRGRGTAPRAARDTYNPPPASLH